MTIKKISRRAWTRVAAALGLSVLTAVPVLAQQPDFPTKPVGIMVPYPAGGPSDAIGRIMSIPLGKALGQPVVVENLGGVSGALAAQKVLGARHDGYYLFQGSPNEVILAQLANAAVKVRSEDFRLVHPVGEAVMVFVARKDLPASSVDDLIALSRKHPDKPLTYGSVGVGSLYHLVLEDVQKRAGIKLLHVPYKGNAPVLQDIGGGQLDFAVLVYSAAMGALADQGKVKVIGQLGAERSPLLKDVPTVAEGAALKGLSYRTWSGYLVPRDTPEPVVARLRSAIVDALQSPDVREQLAAQTQVPSPTMTQAEADRFLVSETARYRELARSVGLQPQ